MTGVSGTKASLYGGIRFDCTVQLPVRGQLRSGILVPSYGR